MCTAGVVDGSSSKRRDAKNDVRVSARPYDMRAGPGLAKSAPTPVSKKQTKLRWSGSFESNPEPALAKREPTSVDEGKSD
jgi:hypothetical protein